MKTADVTVILTVKNEESLIGQTIESILSQTHRNFNFFIVDDGSSDMTFKVIKSYKDSRITAWHFDTNAGMTERLNWLVPKIKTKYIARMDSHHLARQDRLAKQISFLEKNQDVLALGSNFIRLDEKGKLILKSNFPNSHEQIKSKLMEKNLFRHSSMMFQTKLYQEIGFYDPYFKLAQDYDFILRSASKHKVANLEGHLITEIHRAENMTQKFRTRSAWEALAAQWNGLTKYDYPLWQAIYLVRGLGFLAKSFIYSQAKIFR